MGKFGDDYRVLVAQNFLSNISLDGTHQDTNLRIFSAPGLPKIAPSVRRNDASVVTINTIQADTLDSVSDDNIPIDDDLDFTVSCAPSTSYEPVKKKSFFQRFVKIVSSDDVLRDNHEMESLNVTDQRRGESRCGSPVSISQFSFLKLLKNSLTIGEREFICSASTNVPLAVFSYIRANEAHPGPSNPFKSGLLPRKRVRSRSIFDSIDTKFRFVATNGQEEITPFVFKDSEELIHFGPMFLRQRQRQPKYSQLERPKRDRKESSHNRRSTEYLECSVDSFSKVDRISRGTSIDDELADADIDEYKPIQFEEGPIGSKTVIRLSSFISTTYHFIPHERAKNSMNQDFNEKHPHVHLSLSKMMSLKREIIQLAEAHFVDSYTIAYAFSYFEKVVSKGLISKDNRKCVAGCCLLIAMKLNDYSKQVVKDFTRTAEEKLRESRKDILAHELPVCAALQFKLIPKIEELESYNDKIQFYL